MREIKASEFKAKCLRLLDEVAETGEPIVVTKRGKAVARLEPERGSFAKMRGAYKGRIEVPKGDFPPGWTETEMKHWEAKLDRIARDFASAQSPGRHPRKKA